MALAGASCETGAAGDLDLARARELLAGAQNSE
jgi:hypothetical protein